MYNKAYIMHHIPVVIVGNASKRVIPASAYTHTTAYVNTQPTVNNVTQPTNNASSNSDSIVS